MTEQERARLALEALNFIDEGDNMLDSDGEVMVSSEVMETIRLALIRMADDTMVYVPKDMVDVLNMVDAWGNGLRHETAHESNMVKAARKILRELKPYRKVGK